VEFNIAAPEKYYVGKFNRWTYINAADWANPQVLVYLLLLAVCFSSIVLTRPQALSRPYAFPLPLNFLTAHEIEFPLL